MPASELISLPLDIVFAAGCLTGFYVLFLPYFKLSWAKDRQTLPLPPGPPTLPLIGYIRGLPKTKAWETYNEWAKKYGLPYEIIKPAHPLTLLEGDIIHVPVFKNHIIILNSSQSVFDLLERRGHLYSSRTRTVMLHELQV